MEQAAPAVELRQILYVLGRWKLLMALVVLCTVGSAAAYTIKVAHKVYEASATVQLSAAAAPGTSGGGGGNASDLQGALNAVTTDPTPSMRTYLWQVTSPAVLQAAAAQLQAQGVSLDARALGGMISAENVSGTNLITVAARGGAPRQVTAAADAVAAAFIQVEQQLQRQQLAQAVSFLEGQAADVQQQMTSTTDRLAAAESQAGQSQAATATVSSLTAQETTLQQSYDQAQVSLQTALSGQAALQTELRQVPPTTQATVRSGALQQQTDIIPNAPGMPPVLASGPTETVSTSPNPVYLQLEQDLEAQQVTVAEQQASVAQLRQQLSALRAQLQPLQSTPGSATAQVSALRSSVANLQTTYQTLTAQITDAEIAEAEAITRAGISLGAAASVPGYPVSPKKRLYLGLALLVGLVAAAGLAFLLEQLDHTIKSTLDVRRVAGLPTLAVIPYTRRG